ncbi:MAG: hypothetical protein IPK77_05760 [Cellvibrio sp.]|nr:hypothetical protein [Cellvibrio sp.]
MSDNIYSTPKSTDLNSIVRVNILIAFLSYFGALLGLFFTGLKIFIFFSGIFKSPDDIAIKLFFNLLLYLCETCGVVAAAYFLFRKRYSYTLRAYIVCIFALVSQVFHFNSIFNKPFYFVELSVVPFYLLMIIYFARLLKNNS